MDQEALGPVLEVQVGVQCVFIGHEMTSRVFSGY